MTDEHRPVHRRRPICRVCGSDARPDACQHFRARMSANADLSWALTPDRSARTAPARRAADDRFERLVDPEGIYPPEVRAAMAASKRREHFTRMALKSAEARRKRRGA